MACASFFNNLVINYAPETVYFLHRGSFAITEISIQLYIYWHGVVTNETGTTPSTLGNFTPKYVPPMTYEEEKHVANWAAQYFMYYKLLLTVPAFLVGIFFASWYEKRGHRFQIIVPSLAWIALNALLFVVSVLDVHPITAILVGAAFCGLCGENVLQRGALFSFVAEITTLEERTPRFTRLTSALYFGLFFGSLVNGILFNLHNDAFFLTFFASMLTNTLAVFVTMYYLHSDKIGEKQNQAPAASGTTGGAAKGFQLQNLLDGVRVFTKVRHNSGRMFLCILLASFFMNRLCYMGEEYVTFLFVAGRPLRWEKALLGYYMALRKLGFGLGLLFFLRFFKMNDFMALIIGNLVDISRTLLIAFSIQSWMMFMAATLTLISGLVLPVLKSMMSKEVDPEELRSYSSLVSAAEVLGNIVGSIVFPSIFRLGLDTNAPPGFIFFFESAFIVISLLLALFVVFSKMRMGMSADGSKKADTQAPPRATEDAPGADGLPLSPGGTKFYTTSENGATQLAAGDPNHQFSRQDAAYQYDQGPTANADAYRYEQQPFAADSVQGQTLHDQRNGHEDGQRRW